MHCRMLGIVREVNLLLIVGKGRKPMCNLEQEYGGNYSKQVKVFMYGKSEIMYHARA